MSLFELDYDSDEDTFDEDSFKFHRKLTMDAIKLLRDDGKWCVGLMFRNPFESRIVEFLVERQPEYDEEEEEIPPLALIWGRYVEEEIYKKLFPSVLHKIKKK